MLGLGLDDLQPKTVNFSILQRTARWNFEALTLRSGAVKL
jgi:hypothetical protein